MLFNVSFFIYCYSTANNMECTSLTVYKYFLFLASTYHCFLVHCITTISHPQLDSPQALIRQYGYLLNFLYYVVASILLPSSRMFTAAFMSLSCLVPQLGQTQDLSLNFKSSFLYPQTEQVFELG